MSGNYVGNVPVATRNEVSPVNLSGNYIENVPVVTRNEVSHANLSGNYKENVPVATRNEVSHANLVGNYVGNVPDATRLSHTGLTNESGNYVGNVPDATGNELSHAESLRKLLGNVPVATRNEVSPEAKHDLLPTANVGPANALIRISIETKLLLVEVVALRIKAFNTHGIQTARGGNSSVLVPAKPELFPPFQSRWKPG